MTTIIRCVGKSIFSVLILTFFGIFVYSACPPQQARAETPAAKDIGLQRDAVISKIQAGNVSKAQEAIDNLQQSFAEAIWLQRDNVISKIKAGDNIQAQAALDKLQQDFSDQSQISKSVYATADKYSKQQQDDALHKTILAARFAGRDQISQVVCEIADEYQRQGDRAKADELYKKILSDWSDGSHAVWAKMHLVISDIKKGNASFTQADIDSLMANSSDRNAISQAVCEIADEYRKQGNIDKADELYEKILSNWPDGSHAIWAKMNLMLSNFNDVSVADVAVKELRNNYTSWPSFNDAIFGVAERCYDEGARDVNQGKPYLEKSLELLDDLTHENIPSMFRASVFYVAGQNYMAASDYKKAAEVYQQAVEADSKHIYADYCVFAVGYCYERLLADKLISEAEAKPIIESQYNKLLRDYPQSIHSANASMWLQNNKK